MSRSPKEYQIIRDFHGKFKFTVNRNVPNCYYNLQRAEEPDRDSHGKFEFMKKNISRKSRGTVPLGQ